MKILGGLLIYLAIGVVTGVLLGIGSVIVLTIKYKNIDIVVDVMSDKKILKKHNFTSLVHYKKLSSPINWTLSTILGLLIWPRCFYNAYKLNLIWEYHISKRIFENKLEYMERRLNDGRTN